MSKQTHLQTLTHEKNVKATHSNTAGAAGRPASLPAAAQARMAGTLEPQVNNMYFQNKVANAAKAGAAGGAAKQEWQAHLCTS
eukprot:697429-Pelagomonas_calceolata.AAC.1